MHPYEALGPHLWTVITLSFMLAKGQAYFIRMVSYKFYLKDGAEVLT